MNKIKISSKRLSNLIKECIKQHINESGEWTSINNGSDARFSHWNPQKNDWDWGDADDDNKDFENMESWELSDIKDRERRQDMELAADDNYFDDSDFRFTTDSTNHPLREPMDVIDMDYDNAVAELESTVRESVIKTIKEWGFPEGMDDGDNVTDDWTDFYPDTKEGEKEYSWDVYNYENNITPLRKDFQHKEMNLKAKNRDINQYWTDKEMERGKKLMNKWVDGRRDTEDLEDAYFAPRKEAKEHLKKIVKEALNEISFDTAADAYYKSYDRAIDGFRKGKKETPKQERQRNNLYRHMNDRVKERIDPNMPVVIVGGDKQGKYTMQDILDNFDITRFKDASENSVYKNSKIIGYPVLKDYIGPMWDGDKIRYESPEAYTFFSEAKKQVRKIIKEAFSDYYNWRHFDNDREPQYDAYVVVDNSDGAIVSNYEVQYNPNAKEDAIKDAQDEASYNKYGSYTVYGCIGNEYDENTIVYNTYQETKKHNAKKVNEGVNNDNYTHFAILKPINKIVNGWDYSGYDSDELRQFKNDYFLVDIKDMGFNPKDIKILTKQGCLKQGINPDDDSMWDNGSEYIQ